MQRWLQQDSESLSASLCQDVLTEADFTAVLKQAHEVGTLLSRGEGSMGYMGKVLDPHSPSQRATLHSPPALFPTPSFPYTPHIHTCVHIHCTYTETSSYPTCVCLCQWTSLACTWQHLYSVALAEGMDAAAIPEALAAHLPASPEKEWHSPPLQWTKGVSDTWGQ